ncbi:MAG: hypothetical protein ACRDUA_14600 [Micromonosporaceae bacterium]
MSGEPFAPFVSLAGVLILIAAIGWMISPGFRGWMRYKLTRFVLVLALVVVALSLFTYDWQ